MSPVFLLASTLIAIASSVATTYLAIFLTFKILKREGPPGFWLESRVEYPCRKASQDRSPHGSASPVVCYCSLWLPRWLLFRQLWPRPEVLAPNHGSLSIGGYGNSWHSQAFLCRSEWISINMGIWGKCQVTETGNNTCICRSGSPPGWVIGEKGSAV